MQTTDGRFQHTLSSRGENRHEMVLQTPMVGCYQDETLEKGEQQIDTPTSSVFTAEKSMTALM